RAARRERSAQGAGRGPGAGHSRGGGRDRVAALAAEEGAVAARWKAQADAAREPTCISAGTSL
ncbi:hypothetical protein GPZ74_11875, partial [Burkholderia pseudomallei]|nr:hypothetical protein [Burkholderia pseudomallei]